MKAQTAEWPSGSVWARHHRQEPITIEADRARKWLIKTMKDQKLTQAELAERIGTDPSQISRIKNGIMEPRIGLMIRIAEAIGMKMVFIPKEQFEKMRGQKHGVALLKEQDDMVPIKAVAEWLAGYAVPPLKNVGRTHDEWSAAWMKFLKQFKDGETE